MSQETNCETLVDKHGTEVAKLVNSKVSELQELMSEAHRVIEMEAEELENKKADFEEKSKKLEHVHFGSTIKLDIGGKIYKTSLETLKKDPSSMLASMFSGRFELKPDEDGAYFIDRDGKHFRYVLNYLRTGTLICPDDSVHQELWAEAEFYQIKGIITQLSATPILQTSLIIKTLTHVVTLQQWLPNPDAKWDLLYRSTKDGWGANDFHRKCDNKGPTLVIGRSSNGYIFGGFTSESWTSGTGQAKSDPTSYLFSLTNPSGSQATKILPKSLGDGVYGGISNTSSYPGVHFGTKTTYDLLLLNYATDGRGYNFCNLDQGFTCPSGKDKSTFFVGASQFTVNEVEVFEVTA